MQAIKFWFCGAYTLFMYFSDKFCFEKSDGDLPYNVPTVRDKDHRVTVLQMLAWQKTTSLG